MKIFVLKGQLSQNSLTVPETDRNWELHIVLLLSPRMKSMFTLSIYIQECCGMDNVKSC